MKLRRIFSSFAVIGCVSLTIGCATSRQVAKNEPLPAEAESVSQTPAPEIPAPDPLSQGYALEAAQQWRDAIRFYAGILKEQPAHATALHRLGVIATIQGDQEAAANYYRRAMELDPHNAGLLADAGYFQLLQKQYEHAELLLQQAQVLEPNNERVVNNLAMVQGLRGEIDTALVLFRRVNPPAAALQNLAAVHEQRDEWQLALACYLEAASVDPAVTVPENVLAKVEERRQTAPDVKSWTDVAAEPSLTVTSKVADGPLAQMESVAEPPIKATTKSAPITEQATKIESEADFFPADTPTAVSTDSPESDPVDVEEQHAVTPAAAMTTDAVSAVEEASPMRVRDAALDGCCPVALRDSSQVIDGRAEFCVRHQGVVYALSSADAVRRFREQPERYVPSAGGLDVISIRSGRMERGSFHYSTWFRNRLYLFTSAEHVDEFRADPLRYVDRN